jgi:hypothetical protein
VRDYWHSVLEAAYVARGPAAITALVEELDARGDLDSVKDRLLAEAADEMRSDMRARIPGKLGQAVALIEAGEGKPRVLAAGISRRTYFRARRQCQECQVAPAHSSR